MDYWHNILTEKSWKLLQDIKKAFPFTLIGGWAVYLWAHTHKSKDIDIIVDYETLTKLKKEYNARKNDHLKKYEITKGEIDIDIYIPHYSKLIIPVEEIGTTTIEGFSVASLEYLLILKQAAERERKESEKGEKDRIDIVSLLFACDIDFKTYHELLKKYKVDSFYDRLKLIVNGFSDYKYLHMTPRELKLKKAETLSKLKFR